MLRQALRGLRPAGSDACPGFENGLLSRWVLSTSPSCCPVSSSSFEVARSFHQGSRWRLVFLCWKVGECSSLCCGLVPDSAVNQRDNVQEMIEPLGASVSSPVKCRINKCVLMTSCGGKAVSTQEFYRSALTRKLRSVHPSVIPSKC